MKRYTERKLTAYEHAWEIRRRCEYREYDDPVWSRKFRAFVHGRAWTHAEGPVALFNHAVAWLRRNRILLPGVSVLTRQVSAVRTVAEKRLHSAVAKATFRADPALPAELVRLLEVPDGARFSELERRRQPPTRTTGTAMARALDRVNEISAFQLGRVNLSRVPVNRLSTLARYGLASRAGDPGAGAGAEAPGDGGGERRRDGEAISTAFVESTVNQVISKRMVKKQQMRWTLRVRSPAPSGLNPSPQ